jgi:hypothetical protein
VIEIIFNSVAYTLLILLIAYLIYKNVKLRHTLNNEISAKLQVMIDRNIIATEYKELFQTIENMKLEKSDDFVKFLSDTRNSAFEYIEDAQTKIAEFDELLNAIVEWNNTYGTVAGNVPHAEKIEQISLAYSSIRALLPEKPTPNN